MGGKTIMKRSVKVVSFLAALAFAGVTMPSCKANDDVTFLNFKPEVADNYSVITAAYKKETGKNVTVDTAAQGQYDTTLTADMGTDQKDAPDIFQINGPVGLAKWKNYCSDLSATDLYAQLSDQSLAIKADDKVYAVPNTVEGYGIIYNKALTDKYFALTNKSSAVTATSMEGVKTFAALKAVVEDMTAHKSDLGVQGVFSSTSLKGGEQWRWQTHLFSLPLTGEFGSITAVPKTLNFTYNANYKNIFDLYLDNSVTTTKASLATVDVNTSMAELALGNSIMVQNGNWGAGQILGVDGCKVASSNLKFLPIYMGDMGDNVKEASQGVNVGTENYLCVSNKSSAAKQAASINFLKWLYLGNGRKYVAKAIADGGLGFIPTFKGFRDDLLPSDPLAKEIMGWMEKTGVKSVPWTFNYIPSENVKNTLGADLAGYAVGTTTWDTLVSDTKAKWASEAKDL
jgi:raffinose/stachyose/melibiose transport system substrate-binding protein